MLGGLRLAFLAGGVEEEVGGGCGLFALLFSARFMATAQRQPQQAPRFVPVPTAVGRA